MKKLVLLVAVAISTVVSAQKPLRKVIVETSSAEMYTVGSVTTDSVYRERTFCEKLNYVEMGLDTSTLEMFWDYEYEFFDTLTYVYTSPERYVFNFRKGILKYSKGSNSEKFKINGFTYTGPETYSEGNIYVFTKGENGNNGSYSFYFDSNTFSYSPATDLYESTFQRKEYKVSKVTKK
jgi:hypothetical protein